MLLVSSLHERIGRVNRTCQDLFGWDIVEMMEGKVEHPALFPFRRSQSHPLCRIYRLLNVRNIPTPARDLLPSLDIWPQIRQDKSHTIQTGGFQLLIHALLEKRCGSAGASASVNKCILGRMLGTAQLIDEDLAGLHGGWAAAGNRHAPRAEESFVGVLAQPGRTP